ncbi:hypothetical protein EDC05_006310, partial [Coemansia umbellata]
MKINKAAIRVLALGAIAAVIAAHGSTAPSIDWSSQCAEHAVLVNWWSIRLTLSQKLLFSRSEIGTAKYNQLKTILGPFFLLPSNPNIDVFNTVVGIAGASVIDEYIGTSITNYWRRHPCTIPTTSDVYYATTTSDVYQDTTSDVYQDTTSDVYQDTTSDVYQDTTSDVNQDTTSDVYQDTTSDVYQDTTSDIYQDTTVIEVNTSCDENDTTTSDVYQDTTSDVNQDTTSDVYQDTTSD